MTTEVERLVGRKRVDFENAVRSHPELANSALEWDGIGYSNVEVDRWFAFFCAGRVASWMPITTAPKDGTRFLALREIPILDEDTGITTVICEHCIAQVMLGTMVFSIPAFAAPCGERFTHWMPLLDPPNSELRRVGAGSESHE